MSKKKSVQIVASDLLGARLDLIDRINAETAEITACSGLLEAIGQLDVKESAANDQTLITKVTEGIAAIGRMITEKSMAVSDDAAKLWEATKAAGAR